MEIIEINEKCKKGIPVIDDPKLWFIPIKQENGKYTTLSEEAIWRFREYDQEENQLSCAEVKEKQMKDVWIT